MTWEMVEPLEGNQGTILSDCPVYWPPNQGQWDNGNLFWWPLYSAVCTIIRNNTDSPDRLEIWTWNRNESGVWAMAYQDIAEAPGTGPVLACLEANGTDALIAVYNSTGGPYGLPGYLFGKIDMSGGVDNPVITIPYPGIEEYWGALADSSNSLAICRGTTTDPNPRLLGYFWNVEGYLTRAASFLVTATDGGTGGITGLQLNHGEGAAPVEVGYGWAMELDPIRDVIVVFGGDNGGGVPLNLTREGQGLGEEFSPVETGSPPPARWDTAICYHSGLGGILIYGGNPGYYGHGAWLWNGTIWTSVLGTETTLAECPDGYSTGSHFHRYRARMAYDSTRGRPVIFRGNQSD